MQKAVILALSIYFSAICVHAENQQSTKKEKKEVKHKDVDNNTSIKHDKIEKQVQEQMKREKKYAKEQKFYQGKEYNLSAFEVEKDSLPDVPALDPDYEFDMSSGVYTD
jgi:Ni/Co efflux regulator RcnB